MTENTNVDIEDLVELAIEASKVETITLTPKEGQPTPEILIIPEGKNVLDVKKILDNHRINPERRTGTANHQKLESFIEHINRFKSEHSAIFADMNEGEEKLLCIFDYHDKSHEGTPRFLEHKSQYDFPMSKDWGKWIGKNCDFMSQEAFAYFLETNLNHIVTPDQVGMEEDPDIIKWQQLHGGSFATAADLKQLAKGLDISVGLKIRTEVNLNSGEKQVQFSEEHSDKAGDPINIPNMFLISISIFEMGKPHAIMVRLRYRKRGGTIEWVFDMNDPQKNIDHALTEACVDTQTKTDLPVFTGTPEA